ncbi:hypothetical protein [Massilia sp. Bi118]|uniref:hypothetical protein n=1 Tax=Massilia sp. Bi118 TaxID=2822346 RepID=UPI001E5C2A4B|nr:hypothetical protein [Massilia sp. Bi118]
MSSTDPATGLVTTVPRTDFTSCDYVIWSGADYVTTVVKYNQVMAEPFDPAVAGEYFVFAFASTVGLWWVAHSVGKVVGMLR